LAALLQRLQILRAIGFGNSSFITSVLVEGIKLALPGALLVGSRFMKNRLRILRAEFKWSQADLAERLRATSSRVDTTAEALADTG
jgi:hypothetical protein